MFVYTRSDGSCSPTISGEQPSARIVVVAVVWEGEVSKRKKKKRVELFQAALAPELTLPRPNPVSRERVTGCE